MSAVAFAYGLAPEAVRTLVPVLLRMGHLPAGAPAVDRELLREGVGGYGAELVAVLRKATAPQTVGALETAIASAAVVIPEPANRTPATAFAATYDAGLVREGEATAVVEGAVRKIILAALTTDRALDAGGVLRLLDGRGRPRTAIAIAARARELRDQKRSYKDIAKALKAEFKTDYTDEAVRELLKLRAAGGGKKKRG